MRTMKLLVLILTLTLTLPASSDGSVAPTDEITFTAADGVALYGDIYLNEEGKTAPLIVLFHQAGGDARGEYGPVIPRLLEAGFGVFAIDQRSGGSRFGGVNRTVDGLSGKNYSYCDAYPDLEAALGHLDALEFSGPRIVWGSSYSAALVIRLGVEHEEDLDGVLAFSPASGGPMADCKADPFVPNLSLPALALRPASEMQTESAIQQFKLFEKHGIQTYVAQSGVHGSSMLVQDRVDGDVSPTWDVVLKFLADCIRQAGI